jgi:L-Ala-D/L-Glu epimerase
LRGLKVSVSHVFDGPVALAACAALALALAGQVAACGLTPHPGLQAWPEMRLPFLRGAKLACWENPGLGMAEVMA